MHFRRRTLALYLLNALQVSALLILNGCGGSHTQPLPAPAVSMPALVTADEGGCVASVTPQPGYTYQWSISGGTITSFGDSPRPAFQPSSSGKVQLTCVLVSAEGRTSLPGSASATIVPPPLRPVITAPTFVTDAVAGYKASIPEQSDCTYAWTVTGGILTAGATSSTATFTSSGNGPVHLSCIVTNTAGSHSAPGTFTSASVPPPVQPVISAPTFVTAAQTGYSASVPAQVNVIYAWTIAGGMLTAGDTAPTATFMPAGSGLVQLSCIATNAAGTASNPGTFVSVIVPPPTPPVITAPVFTITGRDGYSASTPTVAGDSFSWSIEGGTLSTSAGDSITFSPGADSALTLRCRSTNQAGTGSDLVSRVVPVVPPPVVPIQQSICLTTPSPTALPLALPDLRAKARMSISMTNQSDNPLLNPQVYSGNSPLPYTFNDIIQTLPVGVSDPERCEAAWRYIRDRYWHYCSAGTPDADPTDNVAGIFSSINGYGFGCCDQVSRYLAQLWTELGYAARVAAMSFHTVAEVYYEGAWHMFDVDHRTFYLRRDGRTVASVADVLADPELVVLAADANGLDPVGWESRRMADLYALNGPGLRYASPSYVPPLPLNLQPGETFTLFHENQTRKNLSTYNGRDSFITDITSGRFQWNLPADQRTLDQFCHQVDNIRATSASTRSILQQASPAPGSLTFRRSSPYPLLTAQVWVRWDALQGTLAARFSGDGIAWSDPVPLTPNRNRAGYTHAADLTPWVKPRRNYFVRLEVDGGGQIQALALESHVQSSRANFPLFSPNASAALHYKDDSPLDQARSVLVTLEAVPLDTQIQGLELARNTTPGATIPSYTEAPELLVAPGLSASPSDTRFDFVYTLERPRLIRKLRAVVKQALPSPTSLSWRVQTRMTPDQPWVDHIAGNQEVLDQLEVDTCITALQFRLLGTASAPIQFRQLAAFGHPTGAAMEVPPVAPVTCITNVREISAPSVHNLTDGNLGTPAITGFSHLDYTLTFVEHTQLSKVLLNWRGMGPDFSNITISGLSDVEPAWVRLGMWAGQGSGLSVAIPLDARVKAIRIQAHGTRPIGFWEAQVFGVSAVP